jgi:hypothetical protein
MNKSKNIVPGQNYYFFDRFHKFVIKFGERAKMPGPVFLKKTISQLPSTGNLNSHTIVIKSIYNHCFEWKR